MIAGRIAVLLHLQSQYYHYKNIVNASLLITHISEIGYYIKIILISLTNTDGFPCCVLIVLLLTCNFIPSCVP